MSNIDASVLATVNDELKKREEQQRRHYQFLHELQEMTRELPRYAMLANYSVLCMLC